jgi:hypothetical protein
VVLVVVVAMLLRQAAATWNSSTRRRLLPMPSWMPRIRIPRKKKKTTDTKLYIYIYIYIYSASRRIQYSFDKYANRQIINFFCEENTHTLVVSHPIREKVGKSNAPVTKRSREGSKYSTIISLVKKATKRNSRRTLESKFRENPRNEMFRGNKTKPAFTIYFHPTHR